MLLQQINSRALHCREHNSSSECQHTSWRMRCTVLVFMLLYGTDHGKCTPPYGSSEKVSAAAGRQPRQEEISLYSYSLQSRSIAMAINMLNNSIINAVHNGAVFMND